MISVILLEWKQGRLPNYRSRDKRISLIAFTNGELTMRQIPAVILALSFMSLLCLSGCKEKKIVGEGPNTEALRELSSFDKLDISGNYQLNIEIAAKQSVRIIAQANVIPYILTKVNSNTLSISLDDSVAISFQEAPSINITMQNLSDITLSGASKMTALKINSKSLGISARGHNQIILSGKSASLSIDSNGDNEIHAENLQASDTKIKISGSSTVFTTTTDNLDAKINGYGKIGYTGTPKNITQEIHGSGVIKRVQ